MLADDAIREAILAADEVDLSHEVFKQIHPRGICLLKRMLNFDADARPTAAEVLRDPYIVERATLSRVPIEGLPGEHTQVRGSACSALLVLQSRSK